MVYQCIISDLTNDNIPEIVLATSAKGNGSIANNTDDMHSYLIILNVNGKVIAFKEMGGIFSACSIQVADVNGDEKKELISMSGYSSQNKDQNDRIVIWDGAASRIRKQRSGFFMRSYLESADINNDGKHEIIVTDGEQKELLIFNYNLELITKQYIGFHVNNVLIDDINADGSVEIIISGPEGTIVFNNNLDPLAKTEYHGRIQTIRQGPGLQKKISFSNSNLLVLSMKRNFTYYNMRLGWLLAGIIIGALSVILMGRFAFRMASRKRYSQAIKNLVAKIPISIILIDRKGNLQLTNNRAGDFLKLKNENSKAKNHSNIFVTDIQEEMNLLFDSLKENEFITKDLSLSDGRKLQIDVHNLVNTKNMIPAFLIIIQDITIQSESKRALEWAAMSQKLAHEIKNPLYTILLTLQRLQLAYQEDQVKNQPTYDKYTNSAIEEVGRLQRVADGFMKFTKMKQPEFAVTPAEALVKQIEGRTREWLPQKVNLKIETERDLPDINVDIELVQRLFFNLFDNAVKAMNGKGRLQFKASLLQSIEAERNSKQNEMVLFELSDTGCGIAEDHIPQLFDPYFSQQDGGTGLGLTICKKIVEDHQGKISIHSKVGVGTTVMVALPVVIDK